MELLKKTYFAFFMLIALTTYTVSAQQDSQYTQYMYNTVSVNPGYAGSRGMLSILGLYRNQWVGLDGAPKTLNFSLNSPTRFKRVGAGINFTSDQIGPSSESIITADISYSLPLNENGMKLSFGVKGGFTSLNIDVSKLSIYNPNDVNLVSRNFASPIVGVGFYLHSEKWYVGLSTPNLLETEHYDDIAVSTATEKMHLYLIGGYVFDLNPNLKFKPATMLKAVSGAPLSIDLSANFLLYEKLTLGAAYRWDAAVSALVGFQISNQFMVGYAYDFDTTELGNYNSGSHEIFLRFELGTLIKNKVNPRFF